MKQLYTFICLWALLLGSFQTTKGQTVPDGVKISIDYNDDFGGFDQIANKAKQARVIMTGENHTFVDVNSGIELKMLRYLNAEFGYRNFIIELGAARAHFLNRYIQTGDTVAMKHLQSATSPAFMGLFHKMKVYNSTLPDSMKIKVWGIDVERFNDLPVIRLGELLPQDGIPESIAAGVEAIHGMSAYLIKNGLLEYEDAVSTDKAAAPSYWPNSQKFQINKSITIFLLHFDSLNTTYREWLGKDYEAVEEVVSWLRDFQQWKNYENTTFEYTWREENIYKNIAVLLDSMPREKFYGQFGRCHVGYNEQNGDCGWYGYNSVQSKLKYRYFKDTTSVLSIGIYYRGFNTRFANEFVEYDSRENLNKEIKALFSSTKPRTVTLIPLAQADELPELKQKFSFVIVNNRYNATPSVPGDTLPQTQSKEPISAFKDYISFNGGMIGNQLSLADINRHVAAQNISVKNQSLIQFEMGMAVVYRKIHFGLNQLVAEHNIFQTDTNKLNYKLQMTTLNLGYQVFRGNRFDFIIDAVAGWGQEQLKYVQETGNLLTVGNNKKIFNHGWVAGGRAQLQIKLFNNFTLGTHASYLHDFTSNQFYYQKTAVQYGNGEKLSNGFGGLHYGMYVGFKSEF